MPSGSGVEWLVERGIGEERALLVEGDRIIGARLHWPGELLAGQVWTAKLTSKASGARRGTAVLSNGAEVLIDHLPAEATEGASLDIRITRAPVAERGRLKLAQARWIAADEPSAGDTSLQGREVRRFAADQWEDLWSAASCGQIGFAGGSLTFSITPAMTLIDVDGDLPPRELALAAIPAIAQGLHWFDLGGSIGIDFPTIAEKAQRKAVDEALGAVLADYPHERTAMNGFGFVQIVTRLEGPSLLHRFATSRVGMCVRMALRRGELAEGQGRVLLLSVHPALKARLKDEWLGELARRSGREVRIEIDPTLALEASQAQIVQQ